MNIKSILLLPVLIASLFGLSACGQKGPLYLPGSEQEAANETTNQGAATTDQESNSQDDGEDDSETEAAE